ncbi:MAG: MATE family efflux transporter [Haloarculaceae archaeon]
MLRDQGWRLLLRFPDALARLGLVDRRRARETFELAVPSMVSAGIWTVLRITDFVMVSLALSDAAVAALEFAFQYYFVGFSLAIAVSSGTISLVARFKGAGDHETADFVVKQSLWFAVAISVPLILVSWLYADALIGVLTDSPRVVALGSVYLQIVMLALAFRFWSMIAARGLEGSGDTRTPMYINLVVIPLNIVLNALLIFGVGPVPRLGIAGAALGTAIANTLGAAVYAAIYLSARFPIRLRLGGRQWDAGIAREIVRVGLPLAGNRLVGTVGRFPFLFMLGVLGTPYVAAFAIGRQIVQLAMIPGWGYATSASTLVGQRLGAGADDDAAAYGWDTVTVALATQLLLAAAFALLARPIAVLSGTESVALTTTFVRVFTLSVAGASVAQTLQGGLRGAGDTTWPLYGAALGTVLRLAITALALPAGFVLLTVGGVALAPGLGLGVSAVFAAVLADRYGRALVNAVRFRSRAWQTVARRSLARDESGAEPEAPD